MDGTLVDSAGVVEGVWARFCEQEGIDLGELLAFSHGGGRPTRCDASCRTCPMCRSRRSQPGWRPTRKPRALIREVAGAWRLVGSLDDVPRAVVTSAPRGMAVARMRAAGLPEVPLLVPVDEVEHGKPDPEGYLRAAAALGVDPGRCVVFEDVGAGIAAGLASGGVVVVVGTLQSGAATGLPRARDLTEVRVVRDPRGIRVVAGR